MDIKRYDPKTGLVVSGDGSVAPAGFDRSRLEFSAKMDLVAVGLAVLALAVIVVLTISYQLIFLTYSIVTIFIFLSYLMLWLDGAWRDDSPPPPKKWPDVTLIIPSFNSGHTIFDTVAACKRLKYPGKVSITVVDDGSTDGSCERLKKVEGILLMRKEKNEGKAAALNWGISRTATPIIGCVDSDTYPQEDALLKAIPYFDGPKVGSVVLFICVHQPKNWVQRMQEVEYWISFGFFFKTVASIGGLYVTPGPMALYSREMFENLGHFDEQNLTEDLEIALRMQRHGWSIKACHTSIAFTEVPATLGRLFRQRVRWFRGGIMNMLKYSDMLLNPKYGSFGLFVLPITLGSGFFSALFIFWTLLNYLRAAWDWALPWLYNPIAAGIPGITQPVHMGLYMYDSTLLFGMVGFLVWAYFVHKSFEMAKETPKLKHVVPVGLMLWFYPLFIGLTFLASYVMEFSGRKYKW
ncbi:Glycosyltransferase AglI [uncultured archaeon]|nr:Glycosyltransferase AglI [uncultured archaeon]